MLLSHHTETRTGSAQDSTTCFHSLLSQKEAQQGPGLPQLPAHSNHGSSLEHPQHAANRSPMQPGGKELRKAGYLPFFEATENRHFSRMSGTDFAAGSWPKAVLSASHL